MKIRVYYGLLLAAFLGMAAAVEQHRPTPYVFPELRYFPAMPVDAHNPVTREGALLGRYLFYDPILSRDSSMACASCHRQAAAFSDAPLTNSRGIDGAVLQRNTPPLFNLAWYPELFWDGRSVSLEQQVFEPVRSHDEMDLDWSVAVTRVRAQSRYQQLFDAAFGAVEIDSLGIAKAIAQFERTLISYRSPLDVALLGGDSLSEDAIEGFLLMNDQTKGDCLHCHPTDAHLLGTTAGFSNNGLPPISLGAAKDRGRGNVTGLAGDEGKFKIPSLRNLGYTAPYMHDGRFSTLQEVLDFYSTGVHRTPNIDTKMGFAHQGGNRLTAEENCKILAFLDALNDPAFVSDTAFGDPYGARANAMLTRIGLPKGTSK